MRALLKKAVLRAGAGLTCLGLLTGLASAEPLTFSGVLFPDGAISFADQVISFTPGSNTVAPFNNPALALGTPDFVSGGPDPRGALALGNGGTLIVAFTDNALVDQSDVQGGLDLYVFEIGPDVQAFRLSISDDLVNWIDLGTLSGQPTGIDIAPFVNPGDSFRYVRLVDARSGGMGPPFAGADIDAIGAIGSRSVPEPATSLLVGASMLMLLLRRRGRS